MKKTEGLKENIAGLKKFSKESKSFMLSFVKDKTAFLRDRAVVNAPILKDVLRPSIEAAPVKESKGVIEGGVTIGNTAYASKMHEGFYNLGPRSSIQPGTPEGGVGRRYVSRVVDFHGKDIEKELKKGMDEILGKLVFKR